jgi:hypothetical protein
VREKLAASRRQGDELPTVAEKRDPQPVAHQRFGHVATVDETELEQTKHPAAANGKRTGLEPSHEPAADAEIDDHAHPQPHPYVPHAERPRRQEH